MMYEEEVADHLYELRRLELTAREWRIELTNILYQFAQEQGHQYFTDSAHSFYVGPARTGPEVQLLSSTGWIIILGTSIQNRRRIENSIAALEQRNQKPDSFENTFFL